VLVVGGGPADLIQEEIAEAVDRRRAAAATRAGSPAS
jgi:hypothetical protein